MAQAADDAANRLLNDAIAGDEAALTVLLTESHSELCAYIRRKIPANLRALLDAEDIVQTAHVEAFRHIARFAPGEPGSFERWLRTIALRRLRNAIRDRRAAKRGGGAAPIGADFDSSATRLLDLIAVSERTPSVSLRTHENIAAVQAALEALPVDYREAVRLVHLEQVSVAEAARRMGKNERAVYNLCHRAKQKLEELLGSRSRYLSSRG